MALKIGIIGNGGISNAHMDGYKALGDRVEVVACCDINFEKAKSYAERYGVKNCYDNCYDMLAENELDAVSVCTWNSAHAECTIAALNAGCHVLCEKPMAMSTEEALAMQAAAEKNGKLLMLGFGGAVGVVSCVFLGNEGFNLRIQLGNGRQLLSRCKHL